MKRLPFVAPFSETNTSPSMLVKRDSSSGVDSRLDTRLNSQPVYDMRKLADLRDIGDLDRLDPLDRISVAQSRLAENMEIYRKSGFHTEFSKRATRPRR